MARSVRNGNRWMTDAKDSASKLDNDIGIFVRFTTAGKGSLGVVGVANLWRSELGRGRSGGGWHGTSNRTQHF